MNIPPKAQKILDLFENAMIVGGFVRDEIKGVPCSDIDIEVYGCHLERIERVLGFQGFKVDAVGKAFGILKVDNEIDVSVPRRENKIGVGHRGFAMEPDTGMSVKDAAARRDFTMNSLAMDSDGTIHDHFDGIQDIECGRLMHTSPAFSEDPLRVLRGMQFASRFDMWMDPATRALCAEMDLSELPKERIWAEWKKWAGGRFPSKGLWLLADCSQLPLELWDLKGCPQDPVWHPEGDVFVHTCHVVDQAARLAVNLPETDRLVLLFAALCHDLGKPATTEFIDGHWRARGHCEAGVEPSRVFLERIGAPQWLIDAVAPLIVEHLVHAGGPLSDRGVRRLAVRLDPSNIGMLTLLAEADHCGRPPLAHGSPLEGLAERALIMLIEDGKPEPIVMGRHLIALGMEPGPAMGVLLAEYFEAQLDGEFDDMEGWVRWRINMNQDPTATEDRG